MRRFLTNVTMLLSRLASLGGSTNDAEVIVLVARLSFRSSQLHHQIMGFGVPAPSVRHTDAGHHRVPPTRMRSMERTIGTMRAAARMFGCIEFMFPSAGTWPNDSLASLHTLMLPHCDGDLDVNSASSCALPNPRIR